MGSDVGANLVFALPPPQDRSNRFTHVGANLVFALMCSRHQRQGEHKVRPYETANTHDASITPHILPILVPGEDPAGEAPPRRADLPPILPRRPLVRRARPC